MKSPKLSLQFSRFHPQRTDQSLQIASTLSLEEKNSFFKKKNKNLEDETRPNNAFVKFLRLRNVTQINNQRCLFFDWYIMIIFFFFVQRWVYSAGYENNIEHSTLHLHTIPLSCQRFDLNDYSSELSFSYWQYIKLYNELEKSFHAVVI